MWCIYIHVHTYIIYIHDQYITPYTLALTHLVLLLLELGQALFGLGGQRALRLEGLDLLLVVLGCWGWGCL